MYHPTVMRGCCPECFKLYCELDHYWHYHPRYAGYGVAEYVAAIDAKVEAIRREPYGIDAVELRKLEQFWETWREASDAEKDAIRKKRAGMTCRRLARLPTAARIH